MGDKNVNEILFNSQVGEVIKCIAIGSFWLEAIGAIITGICLASDIGEVWVFFVSLASIPAIWVVNIFIYGFGQLITNTQKDSAKEIADTKKSTKEKESKKKDNSYDIGDVKVGMKLYCESEGAGVVTHCENGKMTICFVTGIEKSYMISSTLSQFKKIED